MNLAIFPKLRVLRLKFNCRLDPESGGFRCLIQSLRDIKLTAREGGSKLEEITLYVDPVFDAVTEVTAISKDLDPLISCSTQFPNLQRFNLFIHPYPLMQKVQYLQRVYELFLKLLPGIKRKGILHIQLTGINFDQMLDWRRGV